MGPSFLYYLAFVRVLQLFPPQPRAQSAGQPH